MTDIEQPATNAIDPDFERYEKEAASKGVLELRREIADCIIKIFNYEMCKYFDDKIVQLKKKLSVLRRVLSEKENQPMNAIGEKRVRVKFNPAQSGVVDEIKQKTAELINICANFRIYSPDISKEREVNRLAEIAMTKYEEAAMWAVKAATVEKE